MKILAIDDNQDNLISLKALIKDTFPDAQTLTALNGGQGLELAAGEDPDVILLDIVMPDIDGFEICKKLKSDKKLSDIPVIFITSLKGDRDIHVRALECGAEAFLSKPVEEIELIAQIRAMVKIKTANIQKRDEKKRLAALVEDQTRELKEIHTATLNLLEDLRKENEDKKVIEDALRENESRLRFALEGSNDGLWDVQMQTGHVYLSPRGCEILGYGTAGLPDTIWKWNQLVHPDDLPVTNKRLEEHIAGHSPFFEIEQRLVTSTGEWKWMLTRGKVVTRDANGKPIRMTGTHTDITERKLVERRLFLSTEILGILNEPISLPDMIRGVISVIKRETGFDAVGIRLKTGDDFPYFAQDGFSNDFLLTENTLLENDMAGGICKDKDGKPCLQCTCGLVISGKTDPASPLFTPGGSFWTNNSPVLLNIPANQDPRFHPRNKCIHGGYASFALVPIRANQEIVGLLQLNNRKKDSLTLDMVRFFEGVNASFGVALMQKLAEKEKAELELQLRESQKMDAVGQLAGGISHDFNNLLSIVNGYAQILLREPDLSATVRFNIEEILKSGERAALLTRQLLTFSRRQPIEVRIIDLNAVVSNMNTMLRRVVKENINMTMVTGYDLWQIKADPVQIEQIIMNLVINARDAMPDGGTLTLETANIEINEANRLSHYSEIKPGFYTMLSVSDTGCGMDEKVRKHIFEPFFTTKEVGKGTGLGLATVYGILKQSNACVDVHSEPGKGTKFRIYFPKAVNESAVSEEQPELADMPRGTETILLAEDEKIMRQMLKDFLQSIGYTVIPARDGNEALELFEGHKGQIHLLITDIVMPGTTGFELARQVKNLSPEIKLLFMSGYAKPSDTLKMMNITDNLIDKPINLHKLAVKLRKILDG